MALMVDESTKETPAELPPPGPQLHAGMFRQRTLKEVGVALDMLKAEADKSSPVAKGIVLEVLERLSDYVVDRLVLEKTSVGKEVAKLQKHEDKTIARKAEELQAEWRRDFGLRKQVVEGFIEKGSLKRKDARDLEEGLFNSFCPLGLLEGDGYKRYQRHYKRLCTHLRTRGAGSLVDRLAQGEFNFSQVAVISDEHLLSEEQRQQQQTAKEEGLQAALAPEQQPNGALTEEYSCGKCGSNHCCHAEVQTGWHNDQQDMTIFVTCLDCGNRWKAYDDHGGGG
eukprot:TRINITY_DN68269_c0_g1_i1.p1 TRINITY_DN68269_c0_g1~~TRINITY_DN68269_c0_g1_i1.p1  ORF type:complete len:292 (+),score=76.21 TRINITY_DN68269_c0_g1_i1:31-876(+)